jgi:hypothetical protein
MFAPSETVSGHFSHSEEFIKLALNASQGSGGTCFGDSGGPDLLADTDTVLAVNSRDECELLGRWLLEPGRYPGSARLDQQLRVMR